LIYILHFNQNEQNEPTTKGAVIITINNLYFANKFL